MRTPIFRWKLLITLLFVVLGAAAVWPVGSSDAAVEEYKWELPKGFPKPLVPDDNPMSEAKVELGRYLFYDKRLSVNERSSCATCHLQERAFTEDKAVSVGTTGELHPRNSMSLANAAYAPALNWANPGTTHLERQILIPLFGEDPVELGMSGKENVLAERLGKDAVYERLFASAFPKAKERFTIDQIVRSLASFVRSLVSGNSPYDKYRYGGEKNAISEAAKRGEELFFSERMECFDCHVGFNLSGSQVYEGRSTAELGFENNGLYNIDGKGGYPPDNTGLFEFTRQPEDMGRFKVPTLRNIELTSPYMHDGSIKTLEEVVDHYAAGGRTIKSGEYAGKGSESPVKSSFVIGFDLKPGEKEDLIAFLKSLTDKEFITDPRFADPWEKK